MRFYFVRVALATAAIFIVMSGQTSAGFITYSIVDYPADQNGERVTGSITTDGVIGALASSDIVSWSWTITTATGASHTLTSSDGGIAEGHGAVASQSSITIGLPPQGQGSNFLALIGNGDLEYDRFPGDNAYVGHTPLDSGWSNLNPSMGGNDPWVIATVGAVPEPSSLLLCGLGLAGAIGYGLRRGARMAMA